MFELHLNEDFHVRSTFSNGVHSIEENIQAALDRGIKRICCVDRVTSQTQWVPDFVATIHLLRKKYHTEIEIFSGIEAQFLDATGRLDLPKNIEGIDHIFAVANDFPYQDNLYKTTEIRQMLMYDTVSKEQLIRHLVRATTGAMWKYRNVVISHLFSILPKIGLHENDVPTDYIAAIARAAIQTDSMIELSERYLCPSAEITRLISSMGVKMPISSNSQTKEHIGLYRYIVEVQEEIFADQALNV